MKPFYFVISFLLICNLSRSQVLVKAFPGLPELIHPNYLGSKNIIPIAVLDFSSKGISEKIPIFYSMFVLPVDSSLFFENKDFIDRYSYRIINDQIYIPLFAKEALKIPDEYSKYFEKEKAKVDSFKQHGSINSYLKFYDVPEWWQNDRTPIDPDGKPMKFLCQIELYDITGNDCMLYVFYERKRKIIKYVYQWD